MGADSSNDRGRRGRPGDDLHPAQSARLGLESSSGWISRRCERAFASAGKIGAGWNLVYQSGQRRAEALSVASDGGAAGCGPASMGRGIHRAKSYIGIAADVDREAGTENRSGALRMFKN